jgi:hypothetical protein
MGSSIAVEIEGVADESEIIFVVDNWEEFSLRDNWESSFGAFVPSGELLSMESEKPGVKASLSGILYRVL